MPIQAVITGVSPRTVTRKSDGQQFTIYEVNANATNYQARKDVFDQAAALVGQPVLMEVRTEQKGTFTNHYVDSIAANGPAPVPVTTSAPVYTAPSTTSTAASFTVTGGASLPAPPNRDLTIWRQTATKVAAHLSKTPSEFWKNVNDLILFYETGQEPDAFDDSVPF